MFKTVCAILFSLSAFLFTAQAVHAASSSETSATVKKTSVKKSPTSKTTAVKNKNKAKTGQQARNAGRSRGRLVKKVVIVRGKRKVIYVAARSRSEGPPVPSAGDRAGLNHTRDPLELKSNVALVVDEASAQVLLDKNSGVALPIASITKLKGSLFFVRAMTSKTSSFLFFSVTMLVPITTSNKPC